MSSEDIEWLRNEFPLHRHRTLRGETLQAYYRAEMLLNGYDKINVRGCSCQYRTLKNSVDMLYDRRQWEKQDI